MKTVFCRILKNAFVTGDDIRICYTASRGGRTEAAYALKKEDLWRPLRAGEQATGETWTVQPDPDAPAEVRIKRSDDELAENIAALLGDMISRKWEGSLFGCKVRKNELILTCAHDDITFYGMLNGVEDKTVIEVEG